MVDIPKLTYEDLKEIIKFNGTLGISITPLPPNYDLTLLKENEFRKLILLPLLYDLEKQYEVFKGKETYGVHEKGKDIIFYEYDFLGFEVWSAMVVKKGNIHGNTKTLYEVNTQVKQAFRYESFCADGSSIPKKRIMRVYIVCSGNFNHEVYEQILDEYNQHSVFFLDGANIINIYNKIANEKIEKIEVKEETNKIIMTENYKITKIDKNGITKKFVYPENEVKKDE